MRTIRSLRTSALSLLTASGLLLMTVLPGINLFQAQALSNASYLTLSSFSGTPDATITVSGGNFEANETVSIVASENGTPEVSTTTPANKYGEISDPITIPTKLAQGNLLITATGESSNLVATNSYYVTPFTPTLTASVGSTTPYGSFTVNGSGFAPNEAVTLNLAGAITSVQADATGSFKGATITTPNVPAASYTLTGVGAASGASAVAYEYVNGFYPYASPSSYYVMPDTSLGFTGSGFAPGETVTVKTALSGTTISSFKADATGSFTDAGAFSVPASYAGTSVTFVLSGALSNASTTVTTTVGRYYPNVSPTIYYVMPGKTVSFNGNGFLPGETVDVYNGTVLVTTAVADAKGDLTAAGTVTVPLTAAGTSENYTLTGVTSQGSGSVSVQVGAYNPNVSPSAYYALPGTILTFSGTGYAPDEVVAVFQGTVNLGSIAVDANGDFTAAGATPIAYTQANTSTSYKLVGNISNTPITLSVAVGQLQTLLTPSSYYVLPFAPFNVTATGFAPSETVTLTNGTTVLGTAKATALGTATFTGITLPASIATSVQLLATGAISGATATASIGLGSYNPTVTSSNYYVKPGTSVTLSGSGFAPNEKVSITAGTTTTTTTATALGTFSAPFAIPFGNATNTISIVSTGALSGATDTTSLTLAPYNTQVTPSTYYATPGTPVTFTGSGFVAGETIAVDLNGVAVGTETADAKGNLTSTGTYTLPYGKAAVFTLTGAMSGTVNSLTIGLAQFYAGLQLSSYYGDGGSAVTASGSGFAPNELIRIQSGTTTLAKGAANATGSFSLPIQIPYVAASKITITASGSLSGATSSTSYTVATVYNSVTLSDYAVPAGSPVTILGSGFFPGEPVTVTAPGITGTYTFDADAEGNLDDSGLVLPTTLAAGNLTLTINGTESFTTHAITLYVQN